MGGSNAPPEHVGTDLLMLQKLLRRFKSMAALDRVPLVTGRVPDWTMDWDNPAADVAARAELWDLLSHYSRHAFPVRCSWYMETELEFLEPSEMARQIVVHRSYDPNEFDLLAHVLEPGMTFVDVGANFGAYSVFASKLVGPTGQVIAFEPSRRELVALHNNIAVNRLPNVHVHGVAVADASGSATFSVADARFCGHNRIGDIELSTTMPTLRFTTDMISHRWVGLNHGYTEIAIGKAAGLEILIYGEAQFEFALQRIELRPEGGLLGPWHAGPEFERALAIPAVLRDSFSSFQSRCYGQLDVSVSGDHLNLRGRGKAGAAFRCRLDPSREYTFVVHGRGRPDAHVDQYVVGVVTLDEFLLPRGLSSVDALKIDVEGGEIRALRGARALIDKYKPLVAFEISEQILHDKGATVNELKQFFAACGYVLFDVKRGAPRLIDLVGEHASNVVAVPERFLDRVLSLGGLDRTVVNAKSVDAPTATTPTADETGTSEP